MKFVVVVVLVCLTRSAFAEEPAVVDPDTAEVVEAVPLGEDRPLVPMAESRYLRTRLRLRSSEGVPVLERGDGEVLSGRAAFLAMGRSDLASDYTWRQVLRYGLMGSGGGLVAYGTYLVFSDPGGFCDGASGPGDQDVCEQRLDDEAIERRTLGGVTALAGLGVVLVGYLVDASPVSHGEISRLTALHNRALRRREGVVDTSTWRVAPTFTTGGLGLHVQGTF